MLLLLSCAGFAFARQSAQQQSQAPAAKPNAAPALHPQTPVAPTSEPPIRVTTGLVHLVVTVTDKHHHLVTDLDRSDFKITESGVPQDIRFFGRETNLPLRIAVLLDTSNSIRPRLDFEKGAAVN
ncbi:MAG: VWA domain-containing protein, partial [Terracidiphilus sp.]